MPAWLKILLDLIRRPTPPTPPPAPPDPPPQPSTVLTRLIDGHNAERSQRGLGKLTADPSLMAGAQAWAAHMASTRRMVHSNDNVAENIAWNYPDVASVMQGWMNSSGHRANILNENWMAIGVGVERAGDGSLYWCSQFTSGNRNFSVVQWAAGRNLKPEGLSNG